MVILVIGSPSLVFELSVYFSNHLIIYETEHIIKFISEPQNCIISHQPLFFTKKRKNVLFAPECMCGFALPCCRRLVVSYRLLAGSKKV